MGALDHRLVEIARKNETMILRALADVKQAAVADAIGVSEATVSRFKDGELERYARLLAAIGLKCVPLSMRCFKQDEIEALLTLAKKQLESVKTTQDLEWDE